MARFRGLYPTFAALVVLAGCGGDGGSGPSASDVDRVSVSPGSASLTFLGESTTLSASGSANGTAVSGLSFTWSSNNQSVATVSSSGEVTAVGNGTASITATVQGGSASGSATVTVAQAVATLDVADPGGPVAVGATVQLTATAQDQGGAPVGSPALNWSSSDEGVATVDASGLVTGVDAGTATITAAGGAGSDGVEVTVFRENFTPAADQTLTGEIKADVVVIPAGVTITASGPLTIDALGSVTLDGALQGDCVPLTLKGGEDVTVTGRLANGCSDASAPGATLSLVGNGEMMLDGAEIRASGDLEISNDPSLDESQFEALLRAGGPLTQGAGHPCAPGGALQGVCFTLQNGTTVYQGNVGGGAGPGPAKDGQDGANPSNGEDGRNVRLLIQGNAKFAGTTTLWGQDGGRGGDGTVTGNTDQSVIGGDGGSGGNIRVLATGSLDFVENANPPAGESASNIIRSGAGGRGGDATATATVNAGLPKGPSATAKGGNAGAPGLIQVQALGGVSAAGAGLTFQIGQLKRGGNAVATGAPGADATATQAAQDGGDAAAEGGAGASGPDKRLVRLGTNTQGAPVIPDTPAGDGGQATAAPGKGGDGLKPNKDGAAGGHASAKGGAGGNQLLRGLLAAGQRIGDGGAGGDIVFTNALGGTGWSDCRPGEAEEAGGTGGRGGNTLGTSAVGAGGQGRGTGADGQATYNSFGNGGDGGAGNPFGPGGAKGTDGSPAAPKNGLSTSFQDGTHGAPCTPPPTPQSTYVDIGAVPNSGGVVAAGTYSIPVRDASNDAVLAQMSVTYPNGGFIGSNPSRTGLGPQDELILQLTGLDAGGQEAEFTQSDLCFVNAPGASVADPITIESLDASMNVVASQTWPAAAGVAEGEAAQASNCIRILRQFQVSQVAYVLIRGIQAGFIDVQFTPVIVWLLVIAAVVG